MKNGGFRIFEIKNMKSSALVPMTTHILTTQSLVQKVGEAVTSGQADARYVSVVLVFGIQQRCKQSPRSSFCLGS